MTPFQRVNSGLRHLKAELLEATDEMLAFSEVMAMKQNCIEMDDNGVFYVTAAGSLEEVIPIVHKLVEKLERIKKERDTHH